MNVSSMSHKRHQEGLLRVLDGQLTELRESLAAKDRELAAEETLTVYLNRDIDILREQRDEWKARAELEAKRLDWVLKFYGDANRSFSLDTSRKVIDAELSAISAQEPPKCISCAPVEQ